MSRTDDVAFRLATSPREPAANWPGFHPGHEVLRAGTVHTPGGRPLRCDIEVARDVCIRLRDGTRVYADIFRPPGDGPGLAILAWSPYGKRGGHWRYEIFPGRAGVAESSVSGLQKFEGPDPAFWCAADYAVVNVDPRGSFASDGDVQFWSDQEAEDGRDVVEWIAAQDWCADAVVMAGNSWLAVTQWTIAAKRPPHLLAIAPWEGLTDVYRDLMARGGIPNLVLPDQIVANNFGEHRVEDVVAMITTHSLMDSYWRAKIADIEAVDVPAYVVASWTNPIHVRGTLDAFRRLDPSKSWLRVHNSQEWPDQYGHEDDLLAFFDHVVKKKNTGWDTVPRVRLSVLDPGGNDVVDRPENEWPLARAVATPLFLDAPTAALSTSPAGNRQSISYPAADGSAEFSMAFEHDVEITGPMSLRVWVETDTGDDLDLFVYVQKYSPEGQSLAPLYMPGVPSMGATGRLRASHRELDPVASTRLEPVHHHTRERRLRPGEIVAMDIPIWPFGMRWHHGQLLRLIITGRDLSIPYHPGEIHNLNHNTGNHRIHTGGGYDSHLLVPFVE